MAYEQTNNKAEFLTDAETVMKWWPFLFEGLGELQKPTKARETMSGPEFFSLAMRLAIGPTNEGTVMVYTSKKGNPIGFIVAGRSNEAKCVQLISAYINENCYRHMPHMQSLFEEWCKQAGFKEVRVYTRRINGSAMRWFENKLGFSREMVGFVRKLES